MGRPSVGIQNASGSCQPARSDAEPFGFEIPDRIGEHQRAAGAMEEDEHGHMAACHGQRGGFSVDAGLQAWQPGIRAMGDCVAFEHWQAGRRLRLESVQNATDQARHVAGSILGRQADYREVPWFRLDQGLAKLQMAGLSIGADRQVSSGVPEDKAFSVSHFRGSWLLAVDSVDRPGEHMLGRKLLTAGFSPDKATIAEGPQAIKEALSGRAAWLAQTIRARRRW